MDYLPPRPARTLRRRRAARPALVASVLALGLGLAGCSAGGPAAPSASPSASASAAAEPAQVANLDGVSVEGRFGESPTVKFAPFTVAETQSKVLIEGSGPEVTADMAVTVHYQGLNGRTGQVFDASYANGKPTSFKLNGVIPGFSKGLVGKKQGSRVLIAMPGKDGYDSSGGIAQAGIQVGDTLVFVVDIVSVPLSGPSGDKVTQPSGQPTVSGALNDPRISIPAGAAPSQLVVQPLIKGTGDKVATDSTVVVNYRGWLWDGSKQIADTYAAKMVNGQQVPAAPESGPLSDLIKGWQTALKGQPVGSRILIVVPPSQAYPDGSPDQGIPAGATLVYVVDILQVY
ncbi:FKBP-type peptidyl-prolyl cis-trans isomerase [Raineyella sp.]|uniref:FKBP-type peptidyl-prolyl cis-trans isomerase n=1 Tax=Raineyella sp. TaxID=1911550 RepID=UPI002B20BBC5|nr:FKBP-type peptidyl-prolyl cis-trans isomerase [Raineyella sp.]MEA5154536.1 FKBP-type peptidyl-prolyl cis-trans isomerase [Raineyella sp.]